MSKELMTRELMIRYVLCELSEAEQEQIEEAYFTNPVLIQELLAARNDLIDAFVEGTLNAEEHERFQQRMPSSPALAEKVEFARALFQAVNSVGAERQQIDNPNVKPTMVGYRLIGRISRFLVALSTRPQWGLAAASLFILTSVFWFAAQHREKHIEPRPADIIALASPQGAQSLVAGRDDESGKSKTSTPHSSTGDQRLLTDHSKSLNGISRPKPPAKIAASISSFYLPFIANRANNDPYELVIPTQAAMVRLQLEVEEESVHYQAVMQTERGKKIWSKGNLTPRQLRSSRVVVCDIPILMLENKTYVLRLRPQPAADAIDIDYFLKVTKR